MKNLINHWARLIAESNEEDFEEVEDIETIDIDQEDESDDESDVYQIYKQVYDDLSEQEEKMMSEEEFNNMLSEMSTDEKTQYISDLKKISPLIKIHKATKTIDDKIFDKSKAFDSVETFDIHQKSEVLVRPDVNEKKVFVNFVIKDGKKNLQKLGYRLCKDMNDAKKWVASEIHKLKSEGLSVTDFKVIDKDTETIQNKYDRKNPNNQIPVDQIQKLPDTIEKKDPNALMLQYKDLSKGLKGLKAYTFIIYTAKQVIPFESFESNLADALEQRNKEDADQEKIDKILDKSGLDDQERTDLEDILKSVDPFSDKLFKKTGKSKEERLTELLKKSTLSQDDIDELYKIMKSEVAKYREEADKKREEKEALRNATKSKKSTTRNVDKDDLAANQPYKLPIDFSDIGIEPDETNDISDDEIEKAAAQDQTSFNKQNNLDNDNGGEDDDNEDNDGEDDNGDDEENRSYKSNYGDIDNKDDGYDGGEDEDEDEDNKSPKKEPEDYDMTPELKEQIKQYVKELTMGDIEFEEVPDEVKYDGFGDLRPQFKKFDNTDSFDHFTRYN